MASVLPRGEPLTYDDLQRFPDDGHRYELVDGVLLVTPAPNLRHQSMCLRLAILLDAARRPGQVVLTGPYDYKVDPFTVLEPDILVLRREAAGDRFTSEPPVLVVEVLSPSTRRTDLGTKRLAYEGAGVTDYWVVDPEGPSLTVLHRLGEHLVEVSSVSGDERYDADRPFPVSVVPSSLLADL